MMKFTITEFNDKYVHSDVCLFEIFKLRYSEYTNCPTCGNAFRYYKVSGRKCYACQFCGNQIHPLAGTIFHKSDTPLKQWFYAIFLFAASKNGVSAMELQRQLGVTYKTAWRMAKQIRLLFSQDDDGNVLKNIVEVDETYIGGTRRSSVRMENKTAIVGMVERQGEVRAFAAKKTVKATFVRPLIRQHVKLGSHLMTDESKLYKKGLKMDYTHSTVNHHQYEFAKGIIHTNSVEGFWSQLKRSINGTYHAVSPKYLQQYLNEFAWRYNARKATTPIFELLLGQAAKLA